MSAIYTRMPKTKYRFLNLKIEGDHSNDTDREDHLFPAFVEWDQYGAWWHTNVIHFGVTIPKACKISDLDLDFEVTRQVRNEIWGDVSFEGNLTIVRI